MLPRLSFTKKIPSKPVTAKTKSSALVAFKPQPPESMIAVGQLTKANPYIHGLSQSTYRSGFYALYSGRWQSRGAFYNWMMFDVIWLGLLQAKGVLPPLGPFRKIDGRVRRKFTKSLRFLGKGRYRFLSEALREHVIIKQHTGETDPECFYEALVPVSILNNALLQSVISVFTNPATGEEEKDDPLAEDDSNVIDMESDDGASEDDNGDADTEQETQDTSVPADKSKRAKDLVKFGTSQNESTPDPTLNVMGSAHPQALDSFMASASAIVPPALWKEVKSAVTAFIITQIPVLGGTVSVLNLRLKIDKATSQQLLAAEFNKTSPVDLHGLLRTWVIGGINVRTGFRRPPQYVLSLPKIRATTPTEGRPDIRTNADGIAISPTGQAYWLPEEHDAINQYVSEQNERLQNADGTYTSFGEVTAEGVHREKPKLPQRLVYMDWINQKVAYTNEDGFLEYIPTDRFIPAKSSHYANILRHSIYSDSVESTISHAYSLCKFFNTLHPLTPQDWRTFESKYKQALISEGHLYETTPTSEIRILDFFPGGSQAASALVDAFSKLKDHLAANVEVAYLRYSVPNVLRVRGFLSLFSYYEDEVGFDGVLKADKYERSKYLDQGVPEGFNGISVPFARQDPDNPLILLGHQNRVMGKLSSRPDNAVLGVDAGGGKTPMSLYDILSELQEGTIKRPIILCPNYLVANHVQDGTEFTGGQVNFIPITTSVLRRHGLKGIEQFLLKRPPNTIVVVGLSVLARSHTVNYGMESTKIYWFADFLRRFDFDMATLDESHFAKNPSGTQRAVHRIMAMAKKKRIMSGTLAPNNLLDLVSQFALIDPTVLGSVEDFKSKYAEKMEGTKVVKWKPGTEAEVNRLIKGNSVFASVNRVEWEALLPEKVESIIPVDLTENQLAVYRSIMTSVFDSMPQEQKRKLQSLLEQSARIGTPNELPEDAGIDETSIISDIESIVSMYLARIEQFCTAPASDLAGQTLSGDDVVSPKVLMVAKRCQEHVNAGYPGKIIIFTNYVASAQVIYDYLNSLPSFSGKVVLYTAGNKDEAKAEFKENPNKIIMVGVGKSMDTGLNLQHASRLCRVEGAWSPGTIEQGDARIYRPVIKKGGDARAKIFIDFIIAKGTIDVTKFALLVAKTISVEKFKNSGNPYFDELEVPETLKMTVDNLVAYNDMHTIGEYFNAYKQFVDNRAAFYADYKSQHPEGITLHDVKRSANIPDSKIMLRVPYIPQMELYKAQDLGLIRYDRAAKLSEEELAKTLDDESTANDDQEGEQDEKSKFLYAPVHTEHGDGEIVRINKSTLQVQLANGSVVKVHKLEAFYINRTMTNAHDMKKFLTESTTDIALDAQPEVPATGDSIKTARKAAAERKAERAARREERRQRREDRAAERNAPVDEAVDDRQPLELAFEVINGTIGLRVLNSDEDGVLEQLQKFRFRAMPQVRYARLSRPEHLLALIYAWADAGFTMDEEHGASLFSYVRLFWKLKGRLAEVNPHDYVNRTRIMLFMRQTFRPSKNPKEIKPYPWIHDGIFYIALPVAQLSTKMATDRINTKLAIPRVVGDPRTMDKNGIPTRDINIVGKALKWENTSGDELYFLGTKAEMKSKIKELARSGFRIANYATLNEEFKQLKIIPGDRVGKNS